jgi:TonB family protein
MKGWEDTEERVRPTVPSGSLLKAGVFSCLLHIVPFLLLGAGLGTGLTEAGSKVYRVALHPLSSQEETNQNSSSERPNRPRSQKAPPPSKAVHSVPPAIPAETPVRERKEEVTVELKKAEEPVLQSETLKKEASITLPPVLLTRPSEEPLQERVHQPLVAVAPLPSPEGNPETKEPVNKGISGDPADGNRSPGGPSGKAPESGEVGSGPGVGLGVGFAFGSPEGNGYGSFGPGNGGLGTGEGSGDGRPAWFGSGRQAAGGTGGGSGSDNASGRGAGNGERGSGSMSAGGGGGRTRISNPFPRNDAKNPRPVYPPEAKEKGYRGQVLLRVEVLSSGSVGQIEIKRSSGYGVLDQSALKAVKQWKFIPAKQEGVPVAVWVNIPLTFELL